MSGFYWVKGKFDSTGTLISYTEWRGSTPSVGTDNQAQLIATHSGFVFVVIDGATQLSFTGYRKNSVQIDHGYETIITSGMTWATGYIKALEVFQYNSSTDSSWISFSALTGSLTGYTTPTASWQSPSYNSGTNISTFIRN